MLANRMRQAGAKAARPPSCACLHLTTARYRLGRLLTAPTTPAHSWLPTVCLLVDDDAPDLDAPAGWRIGRGGRLVEGAMKTERARRVRVVTVGSLTLGLRQGAG